MAVRNADPLILVSNDDGIRAEGIRALADALSTLGTVWIVAPDRERSAASHSLTLSHPLRVEKIGPREYAVDGTPTDCVNLAVNGILRGKKVALVASGINNGPNMGDDVTYSGTVSAAMEGTILKIPSLAVSIEGTPGRFRFDVAARYARLAAENLLSNGMPKDTFLNINVPDREAADIRGVKITKTGKRIYGDAIVAKKDPRGRKYFWIGGAVLSREEIPGSDLEAVEQGFVSVTPIHYDLTCHSLIRPLSKWKWDKIALPNETPVVAARPKARGKKR